MKLQDLIKKAFQAGQKFGDYTSDENYKDFIDKHKEAIDVIQCCTELPNKMVIELSDEEMQIVSTDELIQMEKEAMEFDGFEGWIVRGKAAILK